MNLAIITSLITLTLPLAHASESYGPEEHANDFSQSQRHLRQGPGYGQNHDQYDALHENDYAQSQRHLTEGEGYPSRYQDEDEENPNDISRSQRHLRRSPGYDRNSLYRLCYRARYGSETWRECKRHGII